MQLKKIITLASAEVKSEFVAMERSLRAVGSNLPLWVIPFNDNRFELPSGSSWWEIPELFSWLRGWNSHPLLRKYACLTTEDYQYVDTDVCFLTDPSSTLGELEGFVTSCGHWRDPRHGINDHTKALLTKHSTNWQQRIFNAGQFASSQALFSIESLRETAERPEYRESTLLWPHNDQPGMNLLVHLSKVAVTNLTLAPHIMESTWAGDYPAAYKELWSDAELKPHKRVPYIMHWAGLSCDGSRPIDALYLQHSDGNLPKIPQSEATSITRGEAQMKKGLRRLVDKALDGFGYQLVKAAHYPAAWDMNSEADQEFQRLRAMCAPFTLTSPERMYALYQAINYIHRAEIPGAVVECGVWKGGSSLLSSLTLDARGERERDIFLFDTFRGMTEPNERDLDFAGKPATAALSELQISSFQEMCHAGREEVERSMSLSPYPKEKVHLIEGDVLQTIPHPGLKAISLLRLDTDWFESTYHELVNLYPLLSIGGVLIIDDYGHWRGAREATDEFFRKHAAPVLLQRIDDTGRIAIKTRA